MKSPVFALLCVSVCVACDPEPDLAIEPTPTSVGVPIGEAVSALIGPEGGVIASLDGRAELRVPAGALSEPTEITLQPVTNTAHGGVGEGYELSPDGQTFAAPVELVLHYADADVEGSNPEFLSWAYQDDEMLWRILDTDADPSAGTVTASTTHFTQFSPLIELRVTPQSARVEVEGFVGFQIQLCAEVRQSSGAQGYRFAVECRRPGAFIHSHLGRWRVEGIEGGDDRVGHAGGSLPEMMSYEAPQQVPTPDTVTVSIDVRDIADHPAAPLSARVRILGRAPPYSGVVRFRSRDGSTSDGVAIVNWTHQATADGVHMYVGSGTASFEYRLSGCEPVTLTTRLSGPDPLDASRLQVHTEASRTPREYSFQLNTDEVEFTARCGLDTTTPYDLPGVVVRAVVGVWPCPPRTLTYSDIGSLAGSYDCAGFEIVSDWTFDAM